MEWVARAIGAFYVVAGLIVIRGARQEMLLDRMIEAIELGSGKKTDPAERYATFGGLLIALLTLSSGLALVFLSAWALPLLVLCALTQALFLLYAGRYVRPETPLEELGRRRTTNAFLVYLGATAFVAWLHHRGQLLDWPPAELPWIGGVAAVMLAAFGVLIWQARRLETKENGGTDAPPDDDAGSGSDPYPGDGPIELVAGLDVLRLAPEHGCYPLWHDGTGDNLDPRRLAIDEGLTQRIEIWDATFQSHDPQDPTPDAAAAQHWIEEGRAILRELEARFGAMTADDRFR